MQCSIGNPCPSCPWAWLRAIRPHLDLGSRQGFSMEFHDLPEIASITSMVTLDNVLPGSEDQHNGDYLSTIVKKCTTFCKSNDVSDPIHVLKIFQKEIVTGRPLELTEETSSTGIYGETNFILVDRGDLLKTAIEEIRAISDMRKCLEVQFYGECAADFGGPRKEFFSLVLHCIKEEYFEPVREWSDDYEAVGRILALSTIQNGRLPRIMSAELVEKVFNQVLPVDKYIQDLRKGLDSLGLVQLVQELPAVIHLFTPQQSNPLTVKMLTHLLNPQFSAEGSNRRQRENSTYTLFIKYMREAASGRRGAVNLGSILRFATGTEEEHALSFALQPSIQFMESANFLPTANTCINRMNLSLPDESNPLPLQEELFNLFDLAFCNTFFGLE
ncbi:uncharacterized protein LOC127870915 isoform X4 [Dreissena polymorpha]|uniref:uncharacterized protein LOC127870915 isoform X4 n=1 Tax=Dreissena polymorpha TaxID=45954 RepID=UPI00226406B1|nr:uncharacterized protein LOC127870915 isoform X4 [Dreissena polymorpha]